MRDAQRERESWSRESRDRERERVGQESQETEGERLMLHMKL